MAFKTRNGTRMNKRRRARLKAQAIERHDIREANVKAGLKGVSLSSPTPTPSGRLRDKLGKMATSINSTDYTPVTRERSRSEQKDHEKTYKRFTKSN